VYPSVIADLAPLLTRLKKGEVPGDRVQGVGAKRIFKVRVPNRDAQRGKRGGYRILYYIADGERCVLLTIYSKSEQADIPSQELLQIISEWESEQKK
jgi:mRNA-degrading endonuclease RelE of RelBE toxin-antitoxin system